MGTFPFGWIRDYCDDNWQILWCSETGEISLKGAKTKRLVDVANSPDWFNAKLMADDLRLRPGRVAEKINSPGK